MEKKLFRKIVVVLSFFCIINIFGKYKNVYADTINNEYPDTYNTNENSDNNTNETINNSANDDINESSKESKSSTANSYNKTVTVSNEEDVDHLINYYKKKIDLNCKYKIYGSDIVVQDVISKNAAFINFKKIRKDDEVTVKSFVGDKYVQLQTSSGKTCYESIENFYKHSIKSDAGFFKKSIKKICYTAEGSASVSSYVWYIMIAIVLVLFGMVLINRLDCEFFKTIEEKKNIEPNGMQKIIPGAMLGTFLTILNMCDKNMYAYYFLDGGMSIIGKNYNIEMHLIQITLIVICFMFFTNIKECFKVYEFPSAVIRLLLICIINLLTVYVCNTLLFVGIALYVVIVTIQCTYYGLESPVIEGAEKNESTEAQTT